MLLRTTTPRPLRTALARAATAAALAAGMLAPATTAAAAADTIPPTVALTHRAADLDGWHTGSVDVTVTASDRSGIDDQSSTVTLGGASSGRHHLDGGSVRFTVDATGTTTIDAAVLDNEGNSRRVSGEVRIDNEAPQLGILNLVDGDVLTVGDELRLAVSCSDPGVGTASCVVGGDGSLGDRRIRTDAPGWYTVTLTAEDRLGNRAARSLRYRVVHRDLAPTVQVSPDRAPNGHGWYDAPVHLTVLGTGGDEAVPVTEVRWSVDGGVPTRVAGTTGGLSVAGDGRTTVVGVARDSRGTDSSDEVRDVWIDRTPPTAGVDVPSEVRVGQYVKPVTDCSDALSGIDACGFLSGVGPTGSVDTSTAGTRVVEFRALDRAGNATVTRRDVQVRPSAGPGADLPSQVRIDAPAEVASTQRPVMTVTATHAATSDLSGQVDVRLDGRLVGTYPMRAATRGFGIVEVEADVTLPRLVPGQRRISVRYTAGPGVAPSSAATTIRSRARTTASAVHQLSRIRAGRGSTSRISVRAQGHVPQGSVEVLDGSRRIATGRLGPRGTVEVRLPALAPGTHRLRVRYLGSAATYPATSRTTTIRVR